MNDLDLLPLLVGLERNGSVKELNLSNNKITLQTYLNIAHLMKENFFLEKIEYDELKSIQKKKDSLFKSLRSSINQLLEKNKIFNQVKKKKQTKFFILN